MKCLKCGGKTQVLDTKYLLTNNENKRRRKCLDCGARFNSLEMHEIDYIFLKLARSEYLRKK